MRVILPKEIAHYEGELQSFFQAMVDKLYDNRHKGMWHDIDLGDALELLGSEVDELMDALRENDPEQAHDEATDVANFALMVGSLVLNGTRNPFTPRVKVGRPIDFVTWAGKQKIDECIIWPFKSKTGPNMEYGSLSKGQSEMGRRAHRHACFIANGPPPTPDHDASHLCGNSLCVNGNHLVWETAQENAARKLDHGTIVTPVKLSWDKADEIRKEYAGGKSAAQLAKKYDVSRVSIYKVLAGKAYAQHKKSGENK